MALIIIAYPFGLIIVGIVLNLAVLGVNPVAISLPSREFITAPILGVAALVANHILLMTKTELTRLKYDLYATPEEWVAKGRDPVKASAVGVQELQRCHNAHRNATENVVYFALLVFALALVSPTLPAAIIWIAGFVLGRLGHAYGYLRGNGAVRGIAMTISLISLFGTC